MDMMCRLPAFILRESTFKLDEEFRHFSSLTCGTLFLKGPKAIGQLAQRLFQVGVGSSFLMSLSIKKVKDLELIWGVVLVFGDFAVNRQHVVKGAVHAGETSHPEAAKTEKKSIGEIATIVE